MTRLICDIAQEIHDDWGDKTAIGARPYLLAMFSLRTLTTKIGDTVVSTAYGVESAETVVLYFLSNASTWRGDVAKRVKAELNKMLKDIHKR